MLQQLSIWRVSNLNLEYAGGEPTLNIEGAFLIDRSALFVLKVCHITGGFPS